MMGHNDASNEGSMAKIKKVESDSFLLKGKILGVK
jgi:hypothetical protein